VPARFPSPIAWAIEMPQTCPWILGRTVRGVRNGPSPTWLADRLASIGLRPINALVDVTNFFTFDIGRPLHVFDADKVSGGVLTLRPGAGETFRALNGKDYTVTPDDCAIADAAGVQSLAGVMGGAATGCDEGTTSVFIECALFDPVRVSLTGRRHQIVSDARQRFERGIDPALLPAGLEAATRMIIDLCGGEASEIVAAGAEPRWQRTATLRFARLAELGGLDVPAGEAVASLQRLGFGVVARDAAEVTVSVPSWRNACGHRAGGRPDRGGPAAEGAGRRAAGLDDRSRPGAVADAEPAAGAHGACAADAGRQWPRRMRHLQLYGGKGGGAVRLARSGVAAGQPDRRRSRPVAGNAGGYPGDGGHAQCGARLCRRGAVRGRPGVSRRGRRGTGGDRRRAARWRHPA
jgi:phenylalanyl-tRNA synthetase beta chain